MDLIWNPFTFQINNQEQFEIWCHMVPKYIKDWSSIMIFFGTWLSLSVRYAEESNQFLKLAQFEQKLSATSTFFAVLVHFCACRRISRCDIEV